MHINFQKRNDVLFSLDPDEIDDWLISMDFEPLPSYSPYRWAIIYSCVMKLTHRYLPTTNDTVYPWEVARSRAEIWLMAKGVNWRLNPIYYYGIPLSLPIILCERQACLFSRAKKRICSPSCITGTI